MKKSIVFSICLILAVLNIEAQTETYSFLLTVRNNNANPVLITLTDQIPVSSNSNITVEPVELSGGKHKTVILE